MFSKRFAIAFGCLAAAAQLCAADQGESTIHDNFVVPTISGSGTSEYEVSIESISITDNATGIPNIEAIHNGRRFDVIAKLHWEDQVYNLNSTNTLFWEMSVAGVVKGSGFVNLRDVSWFN